MPYWMTWLRVRANNVFYHIGLARYPMGCSRSLCGVTTSFGGGSGGSGAATSQISKTEAEQIPVVTQ